LIPSIKPKVLYQYYLTNIPNPQCRNPNIDWSKVWKNINNKILSSQARSTWFRLVNNKLPLKVTLFNQNRIASPVCTECNQYAETVVHKYTNCNSTSILWRYVINQIQQKTNKQLSFDQIAFPELNNMRMADKKYVLKIFANFLIYVDETSPNNRNLQTFIFYVEQDIQ
jgi:hypothetical protein